MRKYMIRKKGNKVMRVGLLGNVIQSIRAKGIVNGYGIASEDLMRGFLQFSSAEEFFCMYEPKEQQQELLQIMAGLDVTKRKRVHLINEYDILFHGKERMPEIDVLHSVKEDAIPMLSLRELIKKNIPLTFTLHGLAEQHLLMDFFYPIAHLPFQPYDAVICTSSAVKKTMDKLLKRLGKIGMAEAPSYRIRLEEVPLGVDISYFKPLNRKKCRKKYQILENDFVILWLGRFSDIYKADLYSLIHVFGQLVRNNPEKSMRLILAGNHDRYAAYTDKLMEMAEREQITNHIRFIYNEEIENRAELYSACDVFTSPADNIQETFGLTPIEAMACGIPQVVSDWDGYRDTVKDGETGFLIPTFWADCMEDIACMDFFPSNVNHRRILQRYLAVRSIVVDCEMYREKLQLLIDHPETRMRMGEASRKRAVHEYALEVVVKRTEEVWEHLIDIARQTETDFSKVHVPRLDYCHDFAAYPAKTITDSQLFCIKENAVNFMERVPQYKIFQELIEEGRLSEMIMDYISVKDSFCIKELLLQFPNYTKSQIRRTVLQLYKYDCIIPFSKDKLKIKMC